MVQHVGGGCTQTWVADRLGNEKIWTMHKWGLRIERGLHGRCREQWMYAGGCTYGGCMREKRGICCKTINASPSMLVNKSIKSARRGSSVRGGITSVRR